MCDPTRSRVAGLDTNPQGVRRKESDQRAETARSWPPARRPDHIALVTSNGRLQPERGPAGEHVMQIAGLGAGSTALANAWFLARAGHGVRLWSALEAEPRALASIGRLTAHGIVNGTVSITIAP